VLGEVRVARVVEHRGELLRQADAFVELPQRQQAGVGRERGLGHLDLNGQRRVEIEGDERCRVWTHDGTPVSLLMVSSATLSTNTGTASVTSRESSG
jgi:hypothetical protein